MVAPVLVLVIILVGGVALLNLRQSDSRDPEIGLTGVAELKSPTGEVVGSVDFLQTSLGVLIMAEVRGLLPGGHALYVHEVGRCDPDFDAAGDHFNPDDSDHGFIHAAWRGRGSGGHGGDLPNIYAASDGHARADFLTDGFTLDQGLRHSVFDNDGSAIIVHEHPDSYGAAETDTGDRLVCGVIKPT